MKYYAEIKNILENCLYALDAVFDRGLSIMESGGGDLDKLLETSVEALEKGGFEEGCNIFKALHKSVNGIKYDNVIKSKICEEYFYAYNYVVNALKRADYIQVTQ
ncbi:MAG: hypothetical protein LBI03_08095 [Clostridiales bacterium]|jgi:hypothetical protein|nr:hypothetical protein [Clostridiales bacterium]